MRRRHARRIRAGIRLARYEQRTGWRVRVAVEDPLVYLALQRERERLLTGRRAVTMALDWQGFAP